jgi:FixJ family two-component response regulator
LGPVVIHVVDDEPSVRLALERLLSASGFAVRSYASAEEFLDGAGDDGCALLDIDLPGMSGIELQQELLERGYRWQIVFLSAHRDIIARARASVLKDGAVAVLEKPARAVDLLDAISHALKRLGISRSAHSEQSGEQPPSV